ncbi:hypothetical protein ABT297_29405 [Dactylosporangium sp. NPDC000555]|uniref:hypothetical protein n=1 Tax=Dactylosporangium sp. NPDC000555 TaxID=3154260 RepID=UPI0033311016
MTAGLAGRTGDLTGIERVLMAAFGTALPAHFRARQRAEWAADLADLAREGRPTDRWRYLLAAAWTLPSLRAVARRAQVDGPRSVSSPALPTTRMLAWVVAISLGWTVLSWLLVMAGPYTFEVPARQAAGIDSDPKTMWPGGDPSLPLPLRVALVLGAYAAIGLDPLLVAVVCVVTVGFLLRSRGQAWRDRLRTLARGAFLGLMMLALAAVDLFALTMFTGGVALSVTGIVATGLAMSRFGLPRRWRVALGLLAVAGFAVVIIDNTFGWAMVVWFRD